MADGINIPGVSDKYKTNDLVEALMKVERVPLEREKTSLENYQKQQDAWRTVNQKMSSLRDSVKTLYSFENPFNNKLSSSSDEDAVTVEAGREAEYGSFKIDILQPAAADRFMSDEIDSDYKVPQGKYTFTVGEKTVDFTWKGGKLNDFVNALNKRGGGTVKASLIGVSKDKKSLLIESLKTGEENRLIFENKALDLAKETGMITMVKPEKSTIKIRLSELTAPSILEDGTELPSVSRNNVSVKNDKIRVGARNGFEYKFPEEAKAKPENTFSFTFNAEKVADITEKSFESVSEAENLVLPNAGSITYEGITVYNNTSDSTLPPPGEEQTEQISNANPVSTENEKLFFIKDINGNETLLDSKYFKTSENGEVTVSFKLADFEDPESLVLRNSNTGKEIVLSFPVSSNEAKSAGYEPNHAITRAQDAKIKYEGITMTRASNDVDDIVPHITLHIHDKTEKQATIKIQPDTESAKNAVINFVGKYNQVIAEMNILSTAKPEIISELDYLSKDEQDEAKERLGMFQGDFSLTNGKSSIQRIITTNYKAREDSEITLLSQIGVSGNASGSRSGYNPAQMRGYLEIDEKKLDAALENNLSQIKDLFGFDSDGDLIIDDGIALKLDKTLTSWVQSGGIISNKTSLLDSRIKDSNKKITKLETQLERKEQELKQKYSSMQGTLNNLEGQQTTIQNFSNQNNNKR
ncbi:MAG: flagellar filament capping protein FliD [Treponema sp.]|nr:flagellar filament capping protein FliD [Treponema sp.]